MYTLYNVHVLTPTCTVQYVISCSVNIWLQLYTCFLTMRSKHASSKILNDIGRNSLLGNRKKIAKFLMRTFTCRSTFLYAPYRQVRVSKWRPRVCQLFLWRRVQKTGSALPAGGISSGLLTGQTNAKFFWKLDEWCFSNKAFLFQDTKSTTKNLSKSFDQDKPHFSAFHFIHSE